METGLLFLKERDDKEESFLLESNCLIVPTKLVTPFQSYRERKGRIKGEIHYVVQQKHIYHTQVFINALPECIRYFGIQYPSGRIRWHSVVRIAKVDGQFKVIINNQRPIEQPGYNM